MNLENLNETLKDEPKFRTKQIKDLLYSNFISSWDEASNIPKNLVKKLQDKTKIKINYELLKSSDNKTKKAIITLEDGNRIEAVLMKHRDGRNTVCVSSQVGCPLNCSFCATGKMGYKRNLTSKEIIEQVLLFARLEKPNKITNIVFMGMGEPLLNYENVLESIKTLNDPNYFNIGARKISISTSGILPGIKKLAKEDIQINLAISLHAPNEVLRTTLMPINKKYSLKKLMEALHFYLEQTNRKVLVEYLLLDKINDKEIHAKQLVRLLDHPLFVVNLIPYNNTGDYQKSNSKNIERFKQILEINNINVTQRSYFGGEIDAACGQLASKIKNT